MNFSRENRSDETILRSWCLRCFCLIFYKKQRRCTKEAIAEIASDVISEVFRRIILIKEKYRLTMLHGNVKRIFQISLPPYTIYMGCNIRPFSSYEGFQRKYYLSLSINKDYSKAVTGILENIKKNGGLVKKIICVYIISNNFLFTTKTF